jgi:hypothetical protein
MSNRSDSVSGAEEELREVQVISKSKQSPIQLSSSPSPPPPAQTKSEGGFVYINGKCTLYIRAIKLTLFDEILHSFSESKILMFNESTKRTPQLVTHLFSVLWSTLVIIQHSSL